MIHLRNGVFYSLDPATDRYRVERTLTIEGGRIVAIGAQAGPGVVSIDLDGAVVVPAFCDAHVHLDATGMRAGALDLSSCKSATDFDRALERLPRAQRVFAAGYDDAQWDDGVAGPPALERFHADAIALIMRVDSHSCIVNRKTFALLQVERFEGVERDRDGLPTGRLFGEANWQAQAGFFATVSSAQRHAAIAGASATALAAGVVYVHAQVMGLTGEAEYAAEVAFLRGIEGVQIYPKICERDPSMAARLGLPHIGGDVFLDGSIGSGTAALCLPYADRDSSGALVLGDNDVVAYFSEAERCGISAGVHAIGDRAIDQAVRAIDRALQTRPSNRTRHFIEHAEMASSEQISACARLGVAFSMQPQFDAAWGGGGGMYVKRLGSRAAGMNRFASVRRGGVLLAGGSDSPVCRLSALQGMAAASAHHCAEERLTPLEALTIYTYAGAQLTRSAVPRGALQPGFGADLAVLDRDPFAGAPFEQTRVLETWSGGRRVFSGNAEAPNFVDEQER